MGARLRGKPYNAALANSRLEEPECFNNIQAVKNEIRKRNGCLIRFTGGRHSSAVFLMYDIMIFEIMG